MNIQEQIEMLEKELADLKAKAGVKPWEPMGGQWFVNATGIVMREGTTPEYSEFGTERPTKKLAERALVMMRRFNRLLSYHDEFCPEHDPAGKWDGLTTNYTVFLNNNNFWQLFGRCWCGDIGVYFPEDIAEELCRKLNEGEVVL